MITEIKENNGIRSIKFEKEDAIFENCYTCNNSNNEVYYFNAVADEYQCEDCYRDFVDNFELTTEDTKIMNLNMKWIKDLYNI